MTPLTTYIVWGLLCQCQLTQAPGLTFAYITHCPVAALPVTFIPYVPGASESSIHCPFSGVQYLESGVEFVRFSLALCPNTSVEITRRPARNPNRCFKASSITGEGVQFYDVDNRTVDSLESSPGKSSTGNNRHGARPIFPREKVPLGYF